MLRVKARRVTGLWWRHVPTGADPVSLPAHPPDGRWQRGNVVGAIYLADEPDTAWAEWYRALAELGVPPTRSLPRALWRANVELEVVDLSDREFLSRVGLDAPRPRRVEWATFQAVGEALHHEGWPGLLAPSAARPDHLVLCVFRTEDQLPGITFVPPPERVEEAPTPPRGMMT